jgi:transcriptional regulator with XRE-family HTH domain
MKPVISPTRLKTLRLRLNLTPTKLARKLAKMKTPVTTKTISNIEKHDGETYPVRENTLKSLSRALEVQPEVLSGEASLPAKRSPNDPVIVQLDARTRLNYELIERRYKVSLNDIVNIAPVLFIKAAKESLARQKRVLEEEVLEQARNMSRLPGEPQPHSLDTVPDGLLDAIDNDDDCFTHRMNAIIENDLFEQTVPYEDTGIHHPGEEPNPFAYYLQDICASEIGHNMAYLNDEPYLSYYSYFSGGCIPINFVCEEDIEKITLGSSNARYALTTGTVRIKDIPDELWEPRRAGERVAWLEDKYEMAQQQSEKDDDIEDAVIVD